MHRIDNATANAALPAPSLPGPNPDFYWSDGNPGSGVPATVVEAEWLNMVQEELAGVILAAGLALDKSDRAQLLAALGVGVQQPAFLARRATDQGGFGPSTFVRVVADSEVFDTKGHYDPATGLFTCVTPGLYMFSGSFKIPSGIPDGAELTCELWLNGGAHLRGSHDVVAGVGHTAAATVTGLVNLAAADTMELRGWQSSPGTVTAQSAQTWFSGYRLGKGV